MLSAQISLTLSRHPSISSISSGKSSGLHPVSAQSCCIYVRAGRHVFVRLREEVHRSKSFISSSLLLQQCPACLVRLILNFFYSFRDGWKVGVELLLCRVLSSGLVQYCSQYSYVVAVKLFLNPVFLLIILKLIIFDFRFLLPTFESRTFQSWYFT